jgi:type IV fimbrial biogenesis protein FimT
MHSANRPLPRGFTLIEMLVTLSLAAVLAALAVPSYRSFLANQQLSTASSDFLSALLQARSEAMRLGKYVGLVPIDGANWTSGWQLKVMNNTCVVTGDLAGNSEPLPASVTIDATGTTNSFKHTAPSYTYAASGFPFTACASPYYSGNMNGTIKFISTSTGRERVVIASKTGRARICDPSKETCTGD